MNQNILHHRLAAVVTGSILLGTLTIPAAFGQSTSYIDVPSGAYYEGAANALLESGALEQQRYLRPGDLATRAELVKLLVRLNDEPMAYPSVSSFNDVPKTAWYFPYFEAAARAGWVHGDRNCYGISRPCTARPPSNVNRAEAAALLVRAFDLTPLALAPRFADVASGTWYQDPIQTAADHCVLQGDDRTMRVRPAALMNRAEMVVMFHRASQNMEYGKDCGVQEKKITSISSQSSTRIRISFNVDLDEARAEEEMRYTVARASDGAEIGIASATYIDARTVELRLTASIVTNTRYAVSVEHLLTEAGNDFTDSTSFLTPETHPGISSISALAASRVQITFSDDLDETRAEDESRYQIVRSNGGSSLSVTNATLVSGRRVELTLGGTLLSNTTYTATVQSLLTTSGNVFTDNASFLSTEELADISDVSTQSSTRLRLTFTTDLESPRAEDENRYRLTGPEGDLRIRTAVFVTDRTVDLYLDSSMRAQRSYTIAVTSMWTAAGTTFDADQSFLFALQNERLTTTLRASHEIPATLSTATGSGTFTLQSDGLHYDITIKGLSGAIVAAHFHQGNAASNGTAIHAIAFTGNRAVGTWTDITNDQRNLLLNEEMYVNVHTDRYPNGEIRGQVMFDSTFPAF